MKKSDVDPQRARVLELTQDLGECVNTLRDYAMTPGNAWLAKGELQNITSILNDIEMLVEEIKQSDGSR